MNNTTATPQAIRKPLVWAGLDVAGETFEAALWLPLEADERRTPRQIPVRGFARTPEGITQFLAWADQLEAAELDGLLARYEHAVEMQVLMLQERERRGVLNPARTPREEFLWREISSYFTAAYAAELAWVRKLREEVVTL